MPLPWLLLSATAVGTQAATTVVALMTSRELGLNRSVHHP